MIRLANSSTKTFVSPRLYQPLNSAHSFTTHVINHNLGVTPDNVDMIFDSGNLVPPLDGFGSTTYGWYIVDSNSTSVTLRVYRWDDGDFYLIISSFANRDFDFS